MSDLDAPYSSIGWFREKLGQNKMVNNHRNQGQYFIIDAERSGEIRCVLLNVYTIGIADVMTITGKFPQANCIVTGGNHSSYTPQAEEYGLEIGVGLFNYSEFFTALWKQDFLNPASKLPFKKRS